MVHVPFFNFDIPEPRLAEVLPKAAAAALRGATRVCDAARDALFPLTDAQREQHEQALVAALPRELRRAHKRILLQGKERDALAVSSELEDASYAYYRRGLRSAVAGRSDEDTDDAAWRRLVGGGDAMRDAQRAAERAERTLTRAAAGADAAAVAMSPSEEEDGRGAAAAAQEEEEEERKAAASIGPWQSPRAAVADGDDAAVAAKQQRRQRRQQQQEQQQPLSLVGGLGSGAAGLAVGAAAVELARALAGAMRERSRRRAKEERRRKAREEEEGARAAAAAAGGAAAPARRRRRAGPGGVPRAPRPTVGGA